MARDVEQRILGLESFPVLEPGVERVLYFDTPPEFYNSLVARGYKIVLLSTLPRNGIGEEQVYLKAKLQAVEEGTVVISDNQLTALRTSLELYFGKKAGSLVTLVPASAGEGMLEVLDWGSTRHTMKGNTTLAEARDRPMAGLVDVSAGKKD